MSFQTTLATMALLAVCSLNANAQTDFFWSFNELNSGATNSDADGTFRAGDAATLYLYWAGGDLDTGAGLDLTLSNNGVIEFTGARTFDFDISIGGIDIGNRWLDDAGGGGFAGDAQDVQDDIVTGLHAFTFTGGEGISINNGAPGPFLDEGYDFNADAFLFASVDFVVASPSFATTNILSEVGTIGVVNNAQLLNPSFGNATIRVVPEPTSTCLIALGLLGFSAVRRRQSFS